jgi:hypothetical protein
MAKSGMILTDKQISQVEALASYLNIEQISDYLGISRPTFYAIMERQPEVALHYKKGKAKAIEGRAKSLILQSEEGNTAATIFYLKCQAGWKDTSIIEHAGSVEITEIKRTIIDPANGNS